MEYMCMSCGNIFEQGEQRKWRESRGEFWGAPCYEDMSGCPICGGDYAKAKKCEMCRTVHLEEELEAGVCGDCVEKYRNDIDMCYAIGAHEKDDVSLNSFLLSVFSPEQIEEILFSALKEAKKLVEIDCKEFISNDLWWFCKKLLEEVKKNENG